MTRRCRIASPRSPPVSAPRPVRGRRDTRGMLRQHQFQKVELVSVTKPEESTPSWNA